MSLSAARPVRIQNLTKLEILNLLGENWKKSSTFCVLAVAIGDGWSMMSSETSNEKRAERIALKSLSRSQGTAIISIFVYQWLLNEID